MTNTKIETRAELTNALNAVQKQRKDWEANAYAASNDKLFCIPFAASSVLVIEPRSLA